MEVLELWKERILASSDHLYPPLQRRTIAALLLRCLRRALVATLKGVWLGVWMLILCLIAMTMLVGACFMVHLLTGFWICS